MPQLTRPAPQHAHRRLIPESSPHAQPDRQSSSGVRYSSVLSGLEVLFPPEALAQRNALSRQDGYWPYIHRGDDPPMPLAYGEFDFYFFAELLDRASKYVDPECRQNSWNGKTFCDLGSGTGRLVLAGAALHPGWKLCRGIELLPLISAEASQALKKCRSPKNVIANGQVGPDHNGRDVQDVRHGYELPRSQLPLAPVEFSCGSIIDPCIYFGDSDLVFVCSSCMDADLMVAIATALGRQCRPGALIVTTDYMLPLEGEVPPVENPPDEHIPTGYYNMKLLERVEGWCWLTGGSSTAFIHRLKQSLSVGPLERPMSTMNMAEPCRMPRHLV